MVYLSYNMSIATDVLMKTTAGCRWWLCLQAEDQSGLVEELRRQLMSVRDQLTSSQQRCNAVEAELSQRDGQLVRKSDELNFTETQVTFHTSSYHFTLPRSNLQAFK